MLNPSYGDNIRLSSKGKLTMLARPIVYTIGEFISPKARVGFYSPLGRTLAEWKNNS
jgi:hypothetical protein